MWQIWGWREGREQICLFSPLLWALIAACNLKHWSKFSAFRATTSVHELFSVYLNPPALSLIFCHLVHLTQMIRIGFVFLLKQSWHPRISSAPAGRELSCVCLHSAWGAAHTPGEQGIPRHLGEPGQAPTCWCSQPPRHPKPWGHLRCASAKIPASKTLQKP